MGALSRSSAGVKDGFLGCCTNDCSLKDLLEFGLIVPRVRIHIMSLEIVTVKGTSIGWVCVSVSICMKSRLAKVRCDCRVWQPSAGWFHLLDLRFNVLSLLCALYPPGLFGS